MSFSSRFLAKQAAGKIFEKVNKSKYKYEIQGYTLIIFGLFFMFVVIYRLYKFPLTLTNLLASILVLLVGLMTFSLGTALIIKIKKDKNKLKK